MLSYRPPSVLPQQYFEALDNTLLMVNQISNFSSLFLVGDLNINTSASDFPSSPLYNTLEHFGLHLFKTSHTRVCASTSTTIDIASSSSDGILDCTIIPPLGSSDHFGLLATLNCHFMHSKCPTGHRRKVWVYRSADYNLANDMLLDIALSDIIMSMPPGII